MFSIPFSLGIFREGLGSGGVIGGLARVILAVVGRFVAGTGVLVLMGDWVRRERLCAGPSPGNPLGRREKTPKESGTFGV